MPNKYLNAIKNGIDAMIDTLREDRPTTPPNTEDRPTMSPDIKESDTVSSVPVAADPVTVDEESDIDEESDKEESKVDVVAVANAIPPQPVIPKTDMPEVRVTTCKHLSGGGYAVGCSIQGRSHIMSGCECQDFHLYEDLGDGWMLAIVSDGAGSAREAARGSKANCEITSRLVKELLGKKKWIENNYLPSELEWYVEIRNILEFLQTVINHNATAQADEYKRGLEEKLVAEKKKFREAADSLDRQDEKVIRTLEYNINKPLSGRDFNATLILLLLTPKGMLTAHIGDGRMGFLTEDNQWKSLMTPHKGDEASSTVFVPNNWNRQMEVPTFTMSGVYVPETKVIQELPKAFVLMSDGCESFSWNCSAFDPEKGRYYDRNTPFEKFLTPLIECLNESAENEKVADLINIINVGTEGGKREQDDRTMLLVVIHK